MLKQIIVLSVVASVFACSDAGREVEEEVVRPIRAMQLGSSEQTSERRFPGRAAAANDVTLAFEVSGKLNPVPVSVGDRVAKGALLASLDERDFRNARDQASAEMKRARAQFERMQNALADNAVSKQGVTDAGAAFESAQAMLKIREKALEDTRLIAPYEAIVSATFIDDFGNVQAKQPAIRLVDPTQIEMETDIPEDLILLAQDEMEVFVTFDVFPETIIKAQVSEIGAEASESTRTYPVTLIMNQPEGMTVLPGMAGEAWVAENQVDINQTPDSFHGFEVPITAILSGQGQGSVVWVIDEATYRVRSVPVKVGDLTDAGVLVQGLNGGELIATAGVHHLVENQKVRILE